MPTSKAITFITLVTIILANNTQLRELIVRVHGRSDSATVYYIGSDEEFLSDFVKNEVSIPISIFNADFTSEDLRQCTNVIIVFQVPDTTKHQYHTYSKLLRNVIEKLQVRKFVIISARTLDSLNQYFSFFHENMFTRIFGIIGNTSSSSSSHPYPPLAENPVQQLAENGHLPDSLKDLNGFAIRTNIQPDVPRTFWYPDKHGQTRMAGRVGQTFFQFLRRHNATFREISLSSSNKFYVDVMINATINHEIDISMNAYYRQNNLDLSYPIAVEEHVIMVPWNGYLDPIDYFQRPFQATVWLWIGITVVYITISQVVLNLLTNSKLDIWSSFSEIYLTLLSSSSGKPIISKYRFHLFVILFGFVFERLYGSHFQSFLTAYIKIKQYDTIQDLIDNNVRVMIDKFTWDRMENDLYPKGFDKVAITTDNLEFVQQLISMRNTSFAYAVEGDRCQFFIGFQSLFRKSLFRIAEETINSYHIGFLLPFNSPFKEILDDFIIEIKQTGLFEKWNSDVMNQAKAEGFPMDTDDLPPIEPIHKPLTIHHLKLAWQCLAVGLALSTVIFALEWICIIVKIFLINIK